MSQRDSIYAKPRDQISGFRFDDEVAAVFADMIERSVPGYATILHMLEQVATSLARPGSWALDIGASLGAASLALWRGSRGCCPILAIDTSAAMLRRARALTPLSARPQVHYVCMDARQLPDLPLSLVACNFTLQFIPVADRLPLLRQVAANLLPEGALVLSEKIAFDDPRHQQLMTELHHNFKRANGYTELEISQKRTALENVLIPETLAVHRERLLEAGFSRVDTWFQCFNFASIIAFK